MVRTAAGTTPQGRLVSRHERALHGGAKRRLASDLGADELAPRRVATPVVGPEDHLLPLDGGRLARLPVATEHRLTRLPSGAPRVGATFAAAPSGSGGARHLRLAVRGRGPTDSLLATHRSRPALGRGLCARENRARDAQAEGALRAGQRASTICSDHSACGRPLAKTAPNSAPRSRSSTRSMSMSGRICPRSMPRWIVSRTA